MRTWPAFILSLALCALLSCGSKGAVSLTVFSSNEAVTVRTSPFGGAVVDGTFQLEFVVGGEASGGSDVTLGTFSLQTEARAPLIAVLELETTTVFPLKVEKGGSKRATFALQGNAADAAALCAASVVIVGTVQDSLSGNSQPVRSLPITPSCS